MTYLDYMLEHEDENFSWCKPYVSDDGEYAIVMYSGTPEDIRTPSGDAHRYNGTLNERTLQEFARAVNPDYDQYHDWTDEHIALDAMHETGCAYCPWRDECEAMYETMGENDYR